MFGLAMRSAFFTRTKALEKAFALIAGGSDSNSKIMEMVGFTTDSVTTGAQLSVARSETAAAGNKEKGIWAGGGFGTGALSSTDVYNYSAKTMAAGTTISPARGELAAFSNSASAYFVGGRDSATNTVSNVDVINFSTNGRGAGASLLSIRRGAAAAGNGECAILGMGYITTIVSSTIRYTYSSAAWSNSSNLTNANMRTQASGDLEKALFVGGHATVSAVDIYQYSNNAKTSGSNLNAGREGGAGMSTPTIAMFGAGQGDPTVSYELKVSKRSFSTDSWTFGGKLGYARTFVAGVSTVPGHL